MKCARCGTLLLLKERFCPKCGLDSEADKGVFEKSSTPDGDTTADVKNLNAVLGNTAQDKIPAEPLYRQQNGMPDNMLNNGINNGWGYGQNGGYQQYRNYETCYRYQTPPFQTPPFQTPPFQTPPFQTPPAPPGAPDYAKPSNDMAIVGFVLAITVPLLGLIFSCIALGRAKKRAGAPGRGLAIAGIAISISLLSLSLLSSCLNLYRYVPRYSPYITF